MKWKDDNPRAYYEKYEKVEIKNGGDWFEVYKLPANVYGICEPSQFQEVNLFLILGNERALLLDTGMGIRPIRPLIEELYDGEVVVVNSHFHFDHIANNHCFDQVYVYNDPLAVKTAQTGLPKEALGNQLEERMFRFGYPKGFNPEEYKIPPYTAVPIEDGYCFDLGNRSLKVIHTPGHSNDGIMLHDVSNGILFTGDTFYPGALYAHFDNEEFGKFSFEDYIASMKKVALLAPELNYLYCSHRDFTAPPKRLGQVAEALEKIYRGEPLIERAVDDGHTYLEKGEELREAIFDGFTIIYKNR